MRKGLRRECDQSLFIFDLKKSLLLSDPGHSVPKKARVSKSHESFTNSLIQAGKRIVGQPLLFADEVAITCETNTLEFSTLEPSRIPRNIPSDIDRQVYGKMLYVGNGDQRTDPIVIKSNAEEPVNCHTSTTTHQELMKLTVCRSIPPRHRKIKTALRGPTHRKVPLNDLTRPELEDTTTIYKRPPRNSPEPGDDDSASDMEISSQESHEPDSLYGSLNRKVYESSSGSENEDDGSSPPPSGSIKTSQTVSSISNHRMHDRQIVGASGRNSESTSSSSSLGSSEEESEERNSEAATGNGNRTVHSKPGTSVPRPPLPSAPVQPKSRRESWVRGRQPFAIEDPTSTLDEYPSRNLPSAPHNRSRRILVPESGDLPIVTVSMRSDAQFFDRERRCRISAYSLPAGEIHRKVIDACIVGDTVVVGYGDGPYQVSLIPLIKEAKPFVVQLDHHPHCPRWNLRRNDAHKATKEAALLSCIAPARSGGNAIDFFTGAYDRSIKRWTVRGRNIGSRTVTRCLTVPHALGSRDRKLFYSAGAKLSALDLDHLTTRPTVVDFSNSICHIHVHPDKNNITILEVNHLEEQILVFDDRRKPGFNRSADIKFGYRSKSSMRSSFYRGSTSVSLFARGYSDGQICIWDYRNTKKPTLVTRALQGKIFHTVITGSEIISFSKDSLSFLDFQGQSL